MVLEPGVGRQQRAVGRGGDQEGAVGSGREQLLQFGAGGLDLVDHHDGADPGEVRGELPGVGAEAGGVVGGGEEVLEQVGGGAVVPAELDDAARREVAGRLGHGGEQGAAARAGLADQAYRAALGEQAEQLGDVRLAVEQRQVGGAGAEGERADRAAGAADRAAGGLAAPDPARLRAPLLGAGADLGAVRGADRHEQAAGDQLTAPGAHGLLPELTGWLSHDLLRPFVLPTTAYGRVRAGHPARRRAGEPLPGPAAVLSDGRLLHIRPRACRAVPPRRRSGADGGPFGSVRRVRGGAEKV
ncbi:hypothetical protein ACFQ0M_30525 [Kitasatospora aburaviensis]